MRRSRRLAWWTAYAAGAALVVSGLAWTTVRVVHLEEQQRASDIETAVQDLARASLRRMDAWFSPQLAREAGRMWFEFEPYHPQTIAFNRLLEPIASGEVLVQSSLLSFSDPVFPLHFQWRASTGLTSPQVPSETLLAQGTVGCSPVPPHPMHNALLSEWGNRIDAQSVLARLNKTEVDVLANVPLPAPLRSAQQSAPVQVWAQQQVEIDAASKGQSKGSRGKTASKDVDPADVKGRLETLNAVQKAYGGNNDSAVQTGQQLEVADDSSVEVGPLVPLWLDSARTSLILARRVRVKNESLLQGVVVDWQRLSQEFKAQIADEVPDAALIPVTEDSTDTARLVTFPAKLIVPESAVAPFVDHEKHTAVTGLILVWIAALSAIGVTGLALRSSIGNAVRTSRFASSVTHELRTPLTTFRLYSEMLADGMVPEVERQREYITTLRDESARLGLLVENVLAWSRAEEGRAPSEPHSMTVDALIDEVSPVLKRRCDEAGANFERATECAGDSTLTTDPDRVRQILFNLVDNACKYAGRGATVRLATTNGSARVVLAVEDDGPGVPERMRSRIFRAFDRGERGPGDSVRGLGLGLAISSELARGLGGRMHCGAAASGGARFALELPLAR